MTPKEKAEQLINKFIDASIVEEEVNYYHPKPYSLAIQCALIAVNEILNAHLFDLDEKQYWQQVKTEIEKL